MKRSGGVSEMAPAGPVGWAAYLGAQRRGSREDEATRTAARKAAEARLIEAAAAQGGPWWDAFAEAFRVAIEAYAEARADGLVLAVHRQPRATSARTEDRSGSYLLVTLAIGAAADEDHVELIRRWRARGSKESLSFDVDDQGGLTIRTGDGRLGPAAFAEYALAPWLAGLE